MFLLNLEEPMKKTLFAIFLSALLSPLGYSQQNRCLQNASDDDLIQELSRRLNTGGGGGGHHDRGALVNYNCQGNYLHYYITADNVDYQNDVRADTSDHCLEVSRALNANRDHISGSAVIYICEGNYMNRYKIYEEGRTEELSEIRYNSSQECREQALQLNQQRQRVRE